MRNRNQLFQRRFFRVPFDNPVEFQILKYHRRYISHLSAKRGPGRGYDLGEDGLSFISRYSLPTDMVLSVEFELPELGKERILAKVVRSDVVESGHLSAVQFVNLHGSRKDILRQYIASETKKNYIFLKYL